MRSLILALTLTLTLTLTLGQTPLDDSTFATTVLSSPPSEVWLVLYSAKPDVCEVCPQLEALVSKMTPKLAKRGIKTGVVMHGQNSEKTIAANGLATIPVLHMYTELKVNPLAEGGKKAKLVYDQEAFSLPLVSDWITQQLAQAYMIQPPLSSPSDVSTFLQEEAENVAAQSAEIENDNTVVPPVVIVLRSDPLLPLSLMAFKHRRAVSLSHVSDPDAMSALWEAYGNSGASLPEKVGLIALDNQGNVIKATDGSQQKVTLKVLQSFVADVADSHGAPVNHPTLVSKEDARAARKARREENKRAGKENDPDAEEGDDDATQKSAVVAFDSKKAFTEAIILEDYAWVVEFYSGADQTYLDNKETGKPLWETVGRAMRGKVRVGSVDVDALPKIAKKYKKYLPDVFAPGTSVTLGFGLSSKTKPVVYDGDRDQDALQSFVLSFLPNFVVQVKTSEAASAFFQQQLTKPKIVLFSEAESVSTMYKVLARDFKGSLLFAQIPADSTHLIAGMSDVTEFPALFAAGSFGGDRAQIRFVPFPGPFKTRVIRAFLTQLLREVAQIEGGDVPGSPSPPPPPPSSSSRRSSSRRQKKTPPPPPTAAPHSVAYYGSQPEMDAHCHPKSAACVILVLDAFDGQEGSEANVGYRAILHSMGASLASLPVSLAWTKSHHLEFNQGFRLDFGFPALLVYVPKTSRYSVYVGAFAPKPITDFVKSIARGRARTTPISPFPSLSPSPLDDYEYQEVEDREGASSVDVGGEEEGGDVGVDADAYERALAAAQAAMRRRSEL